MSAGRNFTVKTALLQYRNLKIVFENISIVSLRSLEGDVIQPVKYFQMFDYDSKTDYILDKVTQREMRVHSNLGVGSNKNQVSVREKTNCPKTIKK